MELNGLLIITNTSNLRIVRQVLRPSIEYNPGGTLYLLDEGARVLILGDV